MRSFFIIALLSIILFSCQKDKNNCDDSRPLQERLQGSWELKAIFNPWTQASHTPTTEERQILAFGDSLSVLGHETDTLVAYTITDGWLYSYGVNGAVTIDCNTLIIDNTPVDGPRYTYSRILED